MNPRRRRLNALLALARRGHRARAEVARVREAWAAPPGFATRVAARWAEQIQRRTHADLWERWAWRGALAAVAICVAAAFAVRAVTAPTGFELLLATPQAEHPML